MRCQDFKALIDSYISDELLIETNHEVLRHLENCPDCRSELAAHRQFRTRVRSAVKGSADFNIDPAFARRASSRLLTVALRPNFFEWITKDLSLLSRRNLIAALGCVLLVVFGTFFLIRRSVTPKIVEISSNSPGISGPDRPESNMAQAIRASWDELAREAVGDHKNCALESNLLEKSISLDEAAKKFGAFNKDIEKVVMSALQNSGPDSDPNSNDVKLLGAHSCIFAGRRFTHIVLRKKGEIVSVLVADSDSPSREMVIDSGQVDGNIRVAGFQVDQHAVFVVSSLAATDNDSIASTISLAVRQHIHASAL